MATVEERLATLEARTEALPRLEAKVDDIAAWVNQQKGREALGKYVIPLGALAIAVASFVRGG